MVNQQQGMVMPNMMAQHMMGQFPMGAMMGPMCPMPYHMGGPPGMQMMPPHMMGGPPRPLFPAAGQPPTQQQMSQAKPTFPAYR